MKVEAFMKHYLILRMVRMSTVYSTTFKLSFFHVLDFVNLRHYHDPSPRVGSGSHSSSDQMRCVVKISYPMANRNSCCAGR